MSVGAIAIGAGVASADLTQADWLNPGDGLLTRDSESGLLWLDWTYTANRSCNDVAGNLTSEFAGFRYATEDEIRTLYAHAGAVTIPDINGSDPANIPALQLLMSLVGATFNDGAEAIYDLPGNASQNPSSNPDWGGPGPYHMGTAFNASFGQIAPRWINFDDNATQPWMGHALVMIPAPGSMALIALGALAAVRRRR
ncbi:MAG: hypothetical protein D6695_08135 [Planctomycetota bacterium]|nr:MAG: hypothetical protein D6695_08135 [Planctomycetota bacterium]